MGIRELMCQSELSEGLLNDIMRRARAEKLRVDYRLERNQIRREREAMEKAEEEATEWEYFLMECSLIADAAATEKKECDQMWSEWAMECTRQYDEDEERACVERADPYGHGADKDLW